MDNNGRTGNAMTDRSQHGEQEIILAHFGSETGKFLDLGAGDGITGSNTRALSDLGWDGVCVEASAVEFAKLVHNHWRNPKIACVNAAIMPQNRTRIQTFHECNDQMGTVYEQHKLGDMVTRKWHVATLTPSDIKLSFGRRFEFVSVDIEGMELEVIPALEPLLYETKLVCFEDALPNTPFDLVYYNRLLEAWKRHGFTRVVGRTSTAEFSGNTLLAREKNEPVQTLA